MSRPFRLAGIVAGLVLVGFGVGAILIGLAGRDEVNATIKQEQIVGGPDMTPALIAVKAEEAGLHVALPTCNVAGVAITNGGQAKCFAGLHAHPCPRSDRRQDLRADAPVRHRRRAVARATRPRPSRIQERQRPQSNPARQIWISETALGTALNTSYFASSVGTFAIVMGAALLLTGCRLHRPSPPVSSVASESGAAARPPGSAKHPRPGLQSAPH